MDPVTVNCDMAQVVIWERAKGELRSLMALMESIPGCDTHEALKITRIQDFIQGYDYLIYKGD